MRVDRPEVKVKFFPFASILKCYLKQTAFKMRFYRPFGFKDLDGTKRYTLRGLGRLSGSGSRMEKMTSVTTLLCAAFFAAYAFDSLVGPYLIDLSTLLYYRREPVHEQHVRY